MLRSRSVMTLAPITTIIALLAMACSSSPVSPTSTPPTFATNTVPTAATVTPGTSITPPETGVPQIPSVEPPDISVQPIALDGWASALIVSSTPNATESTEIQRDGAIYVSWAITNDGSDSANSPFSIDLLLDGIPVERWASKGLFVGEVQSVRDWDVLPSRTRLTPGQHALTLLVDSTGYVQSINSIHNSVTETFVWPAFGPPSNAEQISPERLPNLSPFKPNDWAIPINITGLPSEEENLSFPRDPRIQLAYNNSGLSSINQLFLVYMYLDGVLITKFSHLALVSGEAVITPPWRGLLDTIHIPIGFHSLSFKLDPTNLIEEADETDNTVLLRFYWGGALPASPLPSPITQDDPAQIVSYTPTGWSNSLIATSYPGRTGAQGPIYRENDVFVSWAIKNRGSKDLVASFSVDLLLGGEVVHSWEGSALGAGELFVVLDQRLDLTPNPGVYEMRLALNVGELEGFNVESSILTRRSVGWVGGVRPVSVTDELSPLEVTRRLGAIESIRSTSGLATDSEIALKGLQGVVDAVYQTVHQGVLRDEPLAISILTDEEFATWVDAECSDVVSSLNESVQSLYLARCETTKSFIGYHTSWRGIFRIVVKGDRSPMQVLSTIAHELGHFRQSLTNPALDNQANLDVLALRETQAYAHQILFFRSLETMTGLDLLLYPELAGYETFISTQIADLRERSDRSEHARGQLVLWLALLADANLRAERTILLNNLSIPTETADRLFDYLVDFSPSEARIYVTVLMQSIGAQVGAIEELALARLVPGLPYWIEGSPALREVGLLLP